MTTEAAVVAPILAAARSLWIGWLKFYGGSILGAIAQPQKSNLIRRRQTEFCAASSEIPLA